MQRQRHDQPLIEQETFRAVQNRELLRAQKTMCQAEEAAIREISVMVIGTDVSQLLALSALHREIWAVCASDCCGRLSS